GLADPIKPTGPAPDPADPTDPAVPTDPNQLNHNFKYLTYLLGKRRRVEAQRMNGATKEVLRRWFDAYKRLKTEQKIENYNTYNIDETGFSIGTMQSIRIIVDSTLRTRFQAYPGRQEWVSAVECICMDRTTIDPLIIFKGQNIL
ncbi:hypothetical protein V491_00637, partial [Pseudogymnoascus sp. VKM F-3775]